MIQLSQTNYLLIAGKQLWIFDYGRQALTRDDIPEELHRITAATLYDNSTDILIGTQLVAKGLDFANHHFLDFAQGTAGQQVSLDRQKTLTAILPVLRTHSEVQQVLSAFCNDDAERKAIYLVKANESVPCYYELFLALRHMDHTPDMQVRFLLHVARRSTPLAFNFVSIMRAYFGIEKLNGQFSLTLQPYELSRLESGYDGFVKIMNKIK